MNVHRALECLGGSHPPLHPAMNQLPSTLHSPISGARMTAGATAFGNMEVWAPSRIISEPILPHDLVCPTQTAPKRHFCPHFHMMLSVCKHYAPNRALCTQHRAAIYQKVHNSLMKTPGVCM